MNKNNNIKIENSIKIQGVNEFKPSLLNNLKSGFLGFDSLISTGQHLYKGESPKIVLSHAITNFVSSIRQEFQSECKEFNNTAICFNEEQLKMLLACLTAAGIRNDIYIHDMSLNNLLLGNSHSVSIINNTNFITDLLIENPDFELPDTNLTSLNEIIGSLVTCSNVLPLSFSETANRIDFTLLSKRLSSSLVGCYEYSDLIKPGAINIFLYDPETSDFSEDQTPLLISKAFSRGSKKNGTKSRLLISDIACLNDTKAFVTNVLSKGGVDNDIFREIYAVSSQCLIELFEEPLCENTVEHYLLTQLGVDILYNHSVEDGVPRFESFYTVGNKKCSQISLVSKCVYDIVTDNIKFEVN